VGNAFFRGIAWAFAWGAFGMGLAVIGVATSPDTGHVPHFVVECIVSLVSGVVGLACGIAYGLISRLLFLEPKGRIITGAVVGASGIVAVLTIGAIANTTSTEPFLMTFREGIKGMLVFSPAGAVLGGVLGAIDSKLQKRQHIS
jgi:hypothetical protein